MEFLTVSSENELKKSLIGSVFHVTPMSNMESIYKVGGLQPNTNLLNTSKFGNTKTGFFRLRNCVSFFDYRQYGTKQWREHVNKCRPTQIMGHGDEIAIFFLSDCRLESLIPWSRWKDEAAYSQQVVPYIEIGHEGFVSLEYISKILIYRQDC